jgi:LuxR family maltose regulon positive regulatory protein
VVFRANHRKPGPAAPRLIQRGELLASLDRAAEAKVTLISAPAGGGKTSLLRAWADGPGQRYRLAVVQVRRDQQDSQQFWIAVLSAIRQASGTSGEGEQLAATPDFNQGAIVDRVRSELAEHRDRTFLVIDDLHELTSPEALTELTRLLENLPQYVHAILTTRCSLPLRLHKLRLAGEPAEIRTADLRFTQRRSGPGQRRQERHHHAARRAGRWRAHNPRTNSGISRPVGLSCRSHTANISLAVNAGGW